mmetsp:Transcript_79449/g.233490  ORF Transcript_79449/g.233490 Transcript_79449/m.233490 type:complete len:202 (+) Transcript_79449:536-1141(+)
MAGERGVPGPAGKAALDGARRQVGAATGEWWPHGVRQAHEDLQLGDPPSLDGLQERGPGGLRQGPPARRQHFPQPHDQCHGSQNRRHEHRRDLLAALCDAPQLLGAPLLAAPGRALHPDGLHADTARLLRPAGSGDFLRGLDNRVLSLLAHGFLLVLPHRGRDRWSGGAPAQRRGQEVHGHVVPAGRGDSHNGWRPSSHRG